MNVAAVFGGPEEKESDADQKLTGVPDSSDKTSIPATGTLEEEEIEEQAEPRME